MYFLFSATERQHSITTGAPTWLLEHNWGESFTAIPLFLLSLLSMIKLVQTNVRAT